MKKLYLIMSVLAVVSSLILTPFSVSAVSYEENVADITPTLGAGCGTIGVYDSMSNSVSLGTVGAGDNMAITGTFIAPGSKAIVSADFTFDTFNNGQGAGLFFSPVNGTKAVGEGTGIMTWSGDGFAQFKTWTWNNAFTPAAGDDWQDASSVLNSEAGTVYNITAEFAENNTVKVTFTNTKSGNSMIYKDGPVEFVNSSGVYAGIIMLNGKTAVSNYKVTTYKAVYGKYHPVAGTWSYDEASDKITCGSAAVGDNYAGTKELFIEKGKRATVSVDAKYDAFTSGCGIGLFFDPSPCTGIGNGMGVLTWTGSDFTQFKTWCWNPSVIGTTDGDFWDPVENITYGDTDTVYTITAEFYEDETIQCSIKNNTTGAEHILQNKALNLTNENGVYVGVMALNCGATFTDLRVTDTAESSPRTTDAFVSALSVVAVAAVAVIALKKH